MQLLPSVSAGAAGRWPAWILIWLGASLAWAAGAAGDAAAQAGMAGGAPATPPATHAGAGQVLYFVLADRFDNGDPGNDRGGLEGTREDHGFDPTVMAYYQGGDLAGLSRRLDYLSGLGITGIWVTPPFKNKPVQQGTAGYHGYWITDFASIDPHLGTNEAFAAFVRAGQARGIRFYMDIIVNHTADVIQYAGGEYGYVEVTAAPDRDETGRAFRPEEVAWNGVGSGEHFPKLKAESSFARRPVVPAGEEAVKNPAWLNDVTLYHNRGNSAFSGENSLHGDFAGLDDLYTENPRVVRGFIEIYTEWMERAGVDGFRIDTAKHVNLEFWQAFGPAVAAKGRALGRPDFLTFGEVYSEKGDAEFLSLFSTAGALDTTLDFGLFAGARDFISRRGEAEALRKRFGDDDYYTDHDGNAHANVTFLGNHDAGRFGWFLEQDNSNASDATLLELVRLGHGLLFLARGQPTVYYGDEQGMVGTGNDMRARETMFAAQTPHYRQLRLLGTERTGADDKFDPEHPLYRTIAALARLRREHRALSTGAMLMRESGHAQTAAWSRVDREEKVEYLVALNASRTETAEAVIATCQAAGARFLPLFDSRSMERPAVAGVTAGRDGKARVRLAPLQFAVWRAEKPLGNLGGKPVVRWQTPVEGESLVFRSRTVDGQTFPVRRELAVEVSGGDGLAEVSFYLERASRPGQWDYLGTDEAAPFRVFWAPPADLEPGEELRFTAVADDLRGGRSEASLGGLWVVPGAPAWGIWGAQTPRLTAWEPGRVTVEAGASTLLVARAEGTPPVVFQWIKDGRWIPGGEDGRLRIEAAKGAGAQGRTAEGRYAVVARNAAGAAISSEVEVVVAPGPGERGGRVVKVEDFPARAVGPRDLEIWLPPGYDAAKGERYAVIYAHDGQNLFEPGRGFGGVAWGMDRALTRLMAEGRVRPAIVVGIANTGERTAEYMPKKPVPAERIQELAGMASMAGAEIKSDAYLRFLVEELKPMVDREYRTRPGRDDTFVLGSSMGGLISAYALAEYPHVFGGAACISTHWPAADGVVIDWLAGHLPAPGTHRVYFDFGTETLDAKYEPFQTRMDAVMERAGYRRGEDWVTWKFPGAEHSETAWSRRLDFPLVFLLGREF